MHDLFVEPSKKHAHIIIPSELDNDMGLDLILSKLNWLSVSNGSDSLDEMAKLP